MHPSLRSIWSRPAELCPLYLRWGRSCPAPPVLLWVRADRNLAERDQTGPTVNGLRLYSAFVTSGCSKHCTTLHNVHPCIHTFKHRRRNKPRKGTAGSSGAVRVRRLAHGHLETQLGGAGDRTSNLLVTSSQPALPPEPHAGHREPFRNQRPLKVGLRVSNLNPW